MFDLFDVICFSKPTTQFAFNWQWSQQEHDTFLSVATKNDSAAENL